MTSFWEQTKVDDAHMKLCVSTPTGTGPFPGVLVIHPQGGVDEFVQEMIERISATGYVAVAPDMYHRDSPDCRDNPPTRRARLRDATVIKDVNAAVSFLKGHKSVDGARLGIIGFCMGGRIAYLMAAVNPDLKAAVDYYGGNIFFPWGGQISPFEQTAEIHCPIMGHFGEDDENPSPDDMRKLDAGLSKYGKVHEFYSYSGTGHGFMNRRSPNYRRHADEASWPRTVEFFKRWLGAPTVMAAASS